MDEQEHTEVADRLATGAVQQKAVVGVGAKVTHNTGNYNSISVNVFLSVPCEPTQKAINETYEKVSSWVEEKTDAELDYALNKDTD